MRIESLEWFRYEEKAVIIRFPAEEYHQKYLDKNPGGYCRIHGSFFNLGQNR